MARVVEHEADERLLQPAQRAVERDEVAAHVGAGPATGRIVVAQDVAAAITDLRLVLAERLGIRTDEHAERLYDALVDSPQAELEGIDEILDPAARRYLVAVYGALSWLQESLVDLLLHDLRAPGRPAEQ